MDFEESVPYGPWLNKRSPNASLCAGADAHPCIVEQHINVMVVLLHWAMRKSNLFFFLKVCDLFGQSDLILRESQPIQLEQLEEKLAFITKNMEILKSQYGQGCQCFSFPDWCQRQVLCWFASIFLPNTRTDPTAKPHMAVHICDGSTHRVRQEDHEFNVSLHYTVNRGKPGLHSQTRANLKWCGFLW